MIYSITNAGIITNQRIAPNQQFGNPDITIDQSNDDVVYVADYFNNRVVKLDSDGNVITQWGSQGSADGQFNNPQDVGIDSAGFVYVVDTHNHRIQKFTDSGQFVSKWGSQGPTDGQFNFPDRIAIDTNDIIYVTDDGNGRVQKFNTAGQLFLLVSLARIILMFQLGMVWIPIMMYMWQKAAGIESASLLAQVS